MLTGWALLATAWLIGAEAWAEEPPRATITALWHGEEPLAQSPPGEVCLLRDRDLSEVGSLAIGDSLEAGDQLSAGPCAGASSPPPGSTAGGGAPGLLVGLSCGGGTELRFSGAFEVLILEPEAADCALDLADGTLDLLADRPAEITSGGVTIGVEGTQLTLVREGGPREPGERLIACQLFGGRVRIALDRTDPPSRYPAPGEATVLEGGEVWSWNGTAVTRGTIGTTEIAAAAARGARLDVARSWARHDLPTAVTPSEAVARLVPLQVAALSRPDDVASRAELARALLDYGLVERTRFELEGAGILNDTEALQRYDIERDRLEPVTPPPVSPSAGEAAPPTRKVHLATTLGIVIVELPANLRPGDAISGSLIAAGAGPPAKAKGNLRKLGEYQVTFGSATIPVREGPWHLRLDADADAAGRLEVVLRNRRGKAQVRQPLELAATPPVAASPGFAAPRLCRSGFPLTISGPFDGDYRTTRIRFGATPAAVIAETPREAVVACPAGGHGSQVLTIEEAGRRLELASVHRVGLELEIEPPLIKPGEPAQASVRLWGLAGLDEPLRLRIRNESPQVVRLEGGDEQVVMLPPSRWGAGDTAVHTFVLVGRRQGSARIAVDLLP